MKAVIYRVRPITPMSLDIVDISADPNLEARFFLRLPGAAGFGGLLPLTCFGFALLAIRLYFAPRRRSILARASGSLACGTVIYHALDPASG